MGKDVNVLAISRASKPGVGYWCPQFLHRVECFTCLHLLAEESTIEMPFPICLIPKALRMML